MTAARVPTGTYRLQLRAEFGFADAAAIVPYLADLGVSHVYCSPILQAAPGSAHGYDVMDHSRLSDELGGIDGWRRLVDACHAHELGIVVDVVPNHMAISAPENLNAAFWDVLAHGRESSYAEWFDIDWTQHDGRVLLPILPMGTGHVLPPDDRHYLLADWHRGNAELNYRRFFDVTTLAGLRVENDAVFDATHALLGELLHAGDIDGLRVDHPDGLADPAAYLDRLAKLSAGAWTVVEKILETGEELPRSWTCDGTTGYDAVAALTHVLLDPAGTEPLTELYASLTGEPADFHEVALAGKRLVLKEIFGAEVSRLMRELPPSVEASREALVELLAHFDVYRGYGGGPALDRAVQAASAARPDLASELDALRRAAGTRFEQTTGPVMAKGVEDTAFYRYHRLVALNEVGGDPGRFGSDVAEFHAYCARLATDWPATMTTLSTHDTKRSEDVRARLLVLAEIPGEWAAAVTRWRERAQRHGPPDANSDYLLWQTLAGAWPIDAARLDAYLQKAAREAKQHTSWLAPDETYERRLAAYVEAVLADTALVADVAGWVNEHLDAPGRSNSLAQKLLQLAMPGVPDVYQGQELPDFSLVDPDNRRPVDYDLRRSWPDEPKLRVTRAALRLRRDRPEVFGGGYRPLVATGPAATHAVAFARGADEAVAVATRLPVGLAANGGWRDTALALPPGDWHDVLTDRPATAALSTLLDELPVALLVRR